MTDDPRALAARLLAGTRFAMPLQEALEHIRVRRAELSQSQYAPAPDLTAPEDMPHPLVDAPEFFAAEFWKRRAPPQALKRQPKQVKSSRPAADKATPALRIIDGGKGDGGDNGEQNS